MIETILNPLHTDWKIWGITVFCAFVAGLSKSGLKGFAMINIPILAIFYGGMASTGILLPFLIFGDIFAVIYYRRSAEWKYIKKLFPWAMMGLILAVFVGKYVNDDQFRNAIAIAILVCLSLIIYRDVFGGKINITDKKWFSTSLGISGGFATMIGNAAGPIFNLYLMSMRLPKEAFIGTGAFFYLILNLIKVPIHVFYWESITWQTFQLNLICLPILIIGAFIGKRIVKLIPEKAYRYFVLSVITLSAILLFFK
ncbi:sulfite exporter TauE/SafE family protein [Plebeiibacterium marinum]|uniref:Probable membrane transporter protein n=1 Tax=Plebeiibacterium marinum TaxID=2992111 RepID=A0AAE3MGD9_9BACT|nr:sulfite exporter TauE/SafE family protein [Plebeiobacterium marinum]MCW3807162.1 sulfite exporter TauE/SafE family protein [Plebeiobacterium marinum]